MNYYNENDPKAAAWLRELIKANLISNGIVDERSIVDVKAEDLEGYQQCHFFAGIGGWSYALRLAGWPDDEEAWTGSCPCQPFSAAGKRKVDSDERHLWPAFRTIIAERKPSVVFGEQVASKDGRIWLAGVRTDLEAVGYAVGAADLCAAGVSAPHIRQRLYWLAESQPSERRPTTERRNDEPHRENSGGKEEASRSGLCSANTTRMENTNGGGWSTRSAVQEPPAAKALTGQPGENVGLVNADGYHEHWWSGALQVGWNCIEGEIERGGRKHRAQWRIKPSLSLLADGVPGRVAQLCGFGNAIVPQLAKEFIQAYLETKC